MLSEKSTQTTVVGLSVLLACAGLASAGPVLLNDPFNDGTPTSNTGPDAVGPANPWVSYSGGYSGHQGTIAETDGRLTFHSDDNTTPYGLAQLDSRNSGLDLGFYNAVGTTYQYTLGGMTVDHANTQARTDIPGAGLGAIRYELGVISYNDPSTGTNTTIDELYRTTSGGVFVDVYKDANGLVTGNIRETNDQHPQDSDSDGVVGVKTLATFTLGTDGVDPFNVNLALTQDGYALTSDKAVTVTSGAISGTFGTREDGTSAFFNAGDWNNGAFITVGGQNWGGTTDGTGGYGSLGVDQVRVLTTPEPAALLAGVGLVAGLLRRRRA